MASNEINIPLNRSWFYEKPDEYLSRPDFKRFEEIAGVDLKKLLSNDIEIIKQVQNEFFEQSIIANEIQKQFFGFAFPFIVYSHCFDCFENVPRWNIEFDRNILESDMGDSLRRRHIALSHSIIPMSIDQIYRESGEPVMIKNLGSGVGLDMINAVKQRDGMIETVLNYDTNEQAVHFGKTIVEHLESSGDINSGVIQYVGKSLTKSNEPADLIIMIGIICGLQDSIAQFLLSQVHAQLNKGGKLIVSSSNHHMESTDPLVSFLIQHLGTKEDPMKGWQLNFRTEDAMLQVLQGAGFEEIEIYSDTDFPGKSELPDEILFGVDTLPAQAMGFEHPGEPLALPPKEILDRGIAYNWIAVATKA